MSPVFSKIPEAEDEIEDAVNRLSSPMNRYLSRTLIESEITKNPDRYPYLARISPRCLKTFITAYMKGRYPARNTAIKGCLVWTVERV
nr:hypothetical protein [uncultured Methanospirillum sp.]